MANHQPKQLSLPLTTVSAVRLAGRQRHGVVLLLAQLLLSAERPPPSRDGAAAERVDDEPR